MYDDDWSAFAKMPQRVTSLAQAELAIGRARKLNEEAGEHDGEDGDARTRKCIQKQAELERLLALNLSLVGYDLRPDADTTISYAPFGAGGSANVSRRNGVVEASEVKVSPGVFKNRAWLGSTLHHELTHVQQLKRRQVTGGGVNETMGDVEAYQAELDQAARFGLSPYDRGDILSRWQRHLAKLPPDYQQAARERNYDYDPDAIAKPHN